MKKPKFKKKFATGTDYIQPEYNVQSQQRTGKGTAGANALINGGTALAATGGQALVAGSDRGENGVNSQSYVGGKALSGAAAGAQMGSSFGPYGALIGGAVGGVYGGVSGAIQAKSINEAAKAKRSTNSFLKKQANYAATETEQVGYAKKGLDMTKKKLKKFPGGTSSVAAPVLPRFTAAENEQLTPLKGTPQYKQAIQGAIGYVPKYNNPVPGSTQYAYEDSVYNQRVKTFNSRDMTKAPANFTVATQAMDSKNIANNLNYNAQNTKLDSFVANGGAQLPNNLSIPAAPVPGQMPNAMKKTIYKNGTKGIKDSGKMASETQIQMTPAERSALPPTGTQEHRQAIWDLLGYAPKTYPAGSQGYLNQEKHFNAAVDMINQGYRPATSPSGKPGYSKVYSKGSKRIEVEGDEIQLAKKGNKFVVKNDFKNGPTHAEGGIEITAQEGDIITPANKRSQVVEAINTGDHKKLESIRKGLPKDKAYKMKDGTKKVKRDTTEPVSVTPKDFQPLFGSTFQQKQSKDLKKVNSINTGKKPSSKTSTGLKFNSDNLANVAGTLGEIAPIAYNVGQGLFGKVQQTNRRNVNPANFQYTDNSQPLRNEINSLYNQDKQSIRNASGGSAGTYLSNVGVASANKFKRLQEVNNAEAARKVQTQNMNTEMQNNAQAVNIQLNNQYDQADLQNSARKQDFLAAGLGEASQLAQTAIVDKKLANRDRTIVNNLQTGNYFIDPTTQKVVFGKKEDLPTNKKGNSGIKVNKKYKTKKA